MQRYEMAEVAGAEVMSDEYRISGTVDVVSDRHEVFPYGPLGCDENQERRSSREFGNVPFRVLSLLAVCKKAGDPHYSAVCAFEIECNPESTKVSLGPTPSTRLDLRQLARSDRRPVLWPNHGPRIPQRQPG